jgi:pimeloyl-ACP methyl ester carboxylesterase
MTSPTLLVLHGGGGPFTVAPLVRHYSSQTTVLAPTQPGWNGVPLPDSIRSVPDLARFHLDALADAGREDVVVLGSSIGGWIAAEMALQDLAAEAAGGQRRIAATVLINATGIDVPEHPMADFFALSPRELAEHSFHAPDRFFVDPATLPPAEQAVRRENAATLRLLAGDPYMHDPTLRARLAGFRSPALVIWGEADRVVDLGYGRALAASIPGAEFVAIPEAGHLPHIERPEATFAPIGAFLEKIGLEKIGAGL